VIDPAASRVIHRTARDRRPTVLPMYTVDLAIRAEDTLDELPAPARQEVMEVIASVLVQRPSWPPPGEAATAFGRRSCVVFVAYVDGIDIDDIGWAG
jgi:hypothetical protein